jgi:hypothetical protein
VGIQEVRWDKVGTEPIDDYTFLYRKGNYYHLLGTGFVTCKGIRSAVKGAEFVTVCHTHSILCECRRKYRGQAGRQLQT